MVSVLLETLTLLTPLARPGWMVYRTFSRAPWVVIPGSDGVTGGSEGAQARVVHAQAVAKERGRRRQTNSAPRVLD